MQLPEVDHLSFSALVGGLWQRTYSSRKESGQCVFVFQRRSDPRDIRVLRNDCVSTDGVALNVPGFGEMTCHSYIDDPSFAGLTDALERYDSYQVLRYRPGKRITIAAVDRQHGPVIMKYVASGAREIFDRLSSVARVQDELAFQASRPVGRLSESNYFIQERLDGEPISIQSASFSKSIVRAMATAIKSLHSSNALFASIFDARSQSARSDRYLHLIGSRFPGMKRDIDAIKRRLYRLEQRIGRRQTPLVPIHGSLHSHQWLHNDGQLALVDFDRAAMGHPELDIATFLAEFDYESPTIGPLVNRIFLSEFESYDPAALAYYRAHKHLAKAFKASKCAQPDAAFSKTRRNLARTAKLLTDVQD